MWLRASRLSVAIVFVTLASCRPLTPAVHGDGVKAGTRVNLTLEHQHPREVLEDYRALKWALGVSETSFLPGNLHTSGRRTPKAGVVLNRNEDLSTTFATLGPSVLVDMVEQHGFLFEQSRDRYVIFLQYLSQLRAFVQAHRLYYAEKSSANALQMLRERGWKAVLAFTKPSHDTHNKCVAGERSGTMVVQSWRDFFDAKNRAALATANLDTASSTVKTQWWTWRNFFFSKPSKSNGGFNNYDELEASLRSLDGAVRAQDAARSEGISSDLESLIGKMKKDRRLSWLDAVALIEPPTTNLDIGYLDAPPQEVLEVMDLALRAERYAFAVELDQKIDGDGPLDFYAQETKLRAEEARRILNHPWVYQAIGGPVVELAGRHELAADTKVFF